MIETKIIDITNNSRNKHGKMFMTNKFQYDKKKRVASGDYYGGDIMNNDYISRPEFELHQRHMDSRFDAIDEKLDLTKESISSEIKNAISELKVEINKDKVTESKFRIGIAIPSIISVVSIIVTVLIAFFS